MDPKQTSPLGAPQVGGQEGQPVQPTPAVGDVSGANSQATAPEAQVAPAVSQVAAPASPAPVFSTGTAQPAASQKMAGDLGAENLSTGANVSRTMDNLNDAKQSATGAPIFAKHKFDKIEYATGDILLNKDDPKPKRRLFGENFSASRPKSAAEISREARREARRLRRLNKASNNGSVVEPTPAPTSTPAPKANSASQNIKVIVGIVVGVLVVIAGVLGVIALTNGSKKLNNSPSNSTPTVVSEDEVKEAFSDYLSYLFYGDNTKEISAAVANNLEAYRLMNMESGTQEEKNYVANVIALYENFYSVFDDTDFTNYNLLSNYVSSHKNILDFYNMVISNSNKYFISEYLSITNKYDAFVEQGGISAQYASMMNERDNIISAAISDNAAFECISVAGSKLDISTECYNSIIAENADAASKILDIEEEITEQVRSAKNSIPLDASEIYAELSNPTPNVKTETTLSLAGQDQRSIYA